MTTGGGIEWTPQSRPCRRADVEAVDVDGELVLWDPVLEEVHRLDPLGSLLWPFLDGEASLSELAQDAADVWSVPVDDALSSLQALAEQLSGARLLDGTLASDGAAGRDRSRLVDPPSP